MIHLEDVVDLDKQREDNARSMRNMRKWIVNMAEGKSPNDGLEMSK